MNRKIIKLFIFLVGISLFINTFAFSTNLQIDKEKANINDQINLKLTISSEKGGQIQIDEIKGIEKFDIISKSQSSNFSSINGNVTSNINMNFVLVPKQKGTFEIGPVVINDTKQKVETNKVKIEISGDKIFLNGNQNNIINLPKINNNSQNFDNNDLNSILSSQNNENQNSNFNVYLLLGIISILILIVYFALKKTNTLPNNNLEKEVDIIPKKDLIYPELTDENFAIKVDEIFKEKISSEFNINIKTKDYSQILELIKDFDKRVKIKELIDLLSKLKYSNLITDNSKIIELLKEI
ncbi:MAG: BatD family protein [Candidatus Gracilibacteria bacterium]|nr:BatD family protein [Candidatus Gracilibacteria bacterium]